VIDIWGLPLLNTYILLTSGVTVTVAHSAIIENNSRIAQIALGITVLLGVLFTACQAFEYAHSPFSMSDTTYGALFFMCTGFHGFHVFIGTIFLFVCFIRHLRGSISYERHFGFEAASWY